MIYDDLDTMAANSFHNFHAIGLDYLCLHRSEELTIKAYFYEPGSERSPEVVCPHDHRYPFSTYVLAGASGHTRYSFRSTVPRPTHQRFHWLTPLLGGSGFEWSEPVGLTVKKFEHHPAGSGYWCRPDEVHTIRIDRPNTVLLLMQHGDAVPVGTPTSTFVPGDSREPPKLDGLYDRMPLSVAERRLAQVKELMQ